MNPSKTVLPLFFLLGLFFFQLSPAQNPERLDTRIASGHITIRPVDSLDFAAVIIDSSRTLSVRFVNTGTTPLHISNASSSSPAFTVGFASSTVDAGDSLSIAITFAPQHARYYHDSISIVSDDPLTPEIFIRVAGMGSIIRSVLPAANSATAPDTTEVRIVFARDIDAASLTDSSFSAEGSLSGYCSGRVTVDPSHRMVSFSPSRKFLPGESVRITMRQGIVSLTGEALGAYQWNFFIAPATGLGKFSLTETIPRGDVLAGPCIGDFNGDGTVDLTFLSNSYNQLVMMKNLGGLKFSRLTVATGYSPRNLCAGDFDGDGKLEIAVASNVSTVALFKSDAAGNFSLMGQATLGSAPVALSSGDIDGDGRSDLLVTSLSPFSGLSVYKYSATQTLQLIKQIPLPSFVRMAVACDLDGDGDIDLAAPSDNNHQIYILEHLDGLQFAAPKLVKLSGEPIMILCADFDNDGDADIAVLNNYTNSVVMLRNDGRMQFSNAGASIYVGYPITFTAADFDHDGDMDIAVSGLDYLKVLKNNGNFTFASSSLSGIVGAAAADFDNDGDIDFASRNENGLLVIAENKNIAPRITLNATLFDFGTTKLDSVKTTQLTIGNDGGMDPLQISSIVSSNNDLTVSYASGEIKAGESRLVTIQFKPTVSRIYNDSITIISNDPVRPSVKFYVKGIGDEIIALDPPPYSCMAEETTAVRITLGVKPDISTLNDSSVIIRGTHSGTHRLKAVGFDAATGILTLTPALPFRLGEEVEVSLTSKIRTQPNGPPFVPKSWAFTIRTRASSAIFKTRSTIPVPIDPTRVMLRDVNNDGLLDIIVLSHQDEKLSIYRNNGNLSFTLARSIDAGFGPEEFAAGDFDNDGDIDFAVPTLVSVIDLFRNDGDFNFTVVRLAARGYLERVTAGDFNGDGLTDLAAATGSSSAEFDVARNNGNFSFTVSSMTYGSPFSIFASDFNDDGATDIAWFGSMSTTVLKNEGNCTFSTPDSYIGNANPTTRADYDHDGRVDFAGPLWGHEATYGIMINKGEYAFRNLFKTNSRADVGKVLSTDFDNDGNADLLVMCDSGLVSVRNDGRLNFTETSVTLTPSAPYDMAIGDLDNDGDDDAAVISLSSDALTILEQRDPFRELTLGSTGCDFSAVTLDSSRTQSFRISNTGVLPLRIDSIYTSNPAFTVSPQAGTVEPKGSLEVRVTFKPAEFRTFSDSITIISNDSLHAMTRFYVRGRTAQTMIDSVSPAWNAPSGDPSLLALHFSQSVDPASLTSSTVGITGSKSGYHEAAVAYDPASRLLTVTPSGRFIGGEKVTIVVAKTIRFDSGTPMLLPYQWSFVVRVREGSGTFTTTKTLPVGSYPQYLCSADLDNDGIEDIVVSNNSSNTLSIYRSRQDSLPALAAGVGVGSYPLDVASGDLDRDGKIDLIVSAGQVITFLRNTGNFRFTASSLTAENDMKHLTVCDFDGDGDPDIAMASYSSGSVRILRNEGGMAFTPILLPCTVINPLNLDAADFDRDGMPDILLGKGTGNNYTLLHNEGGMTFRAVALENVSGYIRSTVIADFNADARPDIFGASSLLLNHGGLAFERLTSSDISNDPLSLTGADFDNDGDCDLASVNNGYSNTGSIYLNDSLRFRGNWTFGTEAGSHNMISGDFNGDGAMDIAFVNQGSNSIGVVFNIKTKNYALSAQVVPFGNCELGKSSQSRAVIRNTGTKPLLIDSVYVKGSRFSAEVNKLVIPTVDSAVITISFRPDSVGAFTDTVMIASKAESCNRIVLTGTCVPAAAVEEHDLPIPAEYALYQNYPNPFNPTTTIRFGLPEASDVTLKIYDVIGREAATLVNSRLAAGYYSIPFNAARHSSGMYFYRITAASCSGEKKRTFNQVKTLVLMK